MTKHPQSPPGYTVVNNVPGQVLPVLGSCSPPTFKVGVAGSATIKCLNVAFGSTFQIAGVDSPAATWVSPFTIAFTYTPGAAGAVEAQVISPDGRASNKIKLFCVN
jgi:hypothetical protein